MKDAARFDAAAARWSEEAYADPDAYLSHRAELIVGLGPRLAPGDAVLDLACGDGGLARFLPELRYLGVDTSEAMVEAARRRGADAVVAVTGSGGSHSLRSPRCAAIPRACAAATIAALASTPT